MKTKYPEFRKLSLILLIVTILNVLLAVIALPNMIVGTPARRSAVKVMNLSDTWKKNNTELPKLSNLVIDFGKAYRLRAVILVAAVILLMLAEIVIKDMKFILTFQIIVLVICTAVGYFVLLGALLPAMPL